MKASGNKTILIVAIIVAILTLLGLGAYYLYRRFAAHRFDKDLASLCTEEQIANAAISAEREKELLTIAKNVADIFDQFNVRYWIASGSLLGAVRDGGIVPWDDDFDVAMMEDDWKSVTQNEEFWAMLNSKKLMLLKVFGAVDKIVLQRDWSDKLVADGKPFGKAGLQEFRKRYTAFLDLFGYEFDPSNPKKLRLASLKNRITFPKEGFLADDVFPRRKYVFSSKASDPILLSGPNNPFTYLTNVYGKDGEHTWIDTALYASHESLTKMLKSCKLDLQQVQKLKQRQ